MLWKIRDWITPQFKIKIGLEATGHCSYNHLESLPGHSLAPYALNPLPANLY